MKEITYFSSGKTTTTFQEVKIFEKEDGTLLIGLISRLKLYILLGNFCGFLLPILMFIVFIINATEIPEFMIIYILLIIYIPVMITTIFSGKSTRSKEIDNFLAYNPNEHTLTRENTKLNLMDDPIIRVKQIQHQRGFILKEIRIETTQDAIVLDENPLNMPIVEFIQDRLGLGIKEDIEDETSATHNSW